MKTITVVPDKKDPKGYVIKLSTAVSTEDLKNFKADYFYKFEEAKTFAIEKHQSTVFKLEELPLLNNSYRDLQMFMSRSKNVAEWNTNRMIAKHRFTFTVISKLDASGFITKVLNK